LIASVFQHVWNYICFKKKNERNFIKLNITFSETIKNMPELLVCQ